MNEPLVSILIPAYNAARWIGETLDSALGQTWPNTEIIVVDDGSRDKTAAVAECYASRAVKIVRQENLGAAAARNRAVAESQGHFIQYLDADDLLSPDKIERQMRRLREEPACVASGEWARFFQAPRTAIFRAEQVWRDLAPTAWLIESWTGGGPMMQPGIWLVPRSVALKAGPWDDRLSLIDDFEYGTRMLLASDGVRFCSGARLYYRSGNPESLASRRSPAAWRSALLSMQLGTRALLESISTDDARRACADVFQTLAFDAYLEDDEIASAAGRCADELGGSRLRMTGGRLFNAMERTIGWQRAKRVQRVAYSLGYRRVASLKRRVAARGLEATV
jgi:glycosyltransferase involved in cell wall biosynthesis